MAKIGDVSKLPKESRGRKSPLNTELYALPAGKFQTRTGGYSAAATAQSGVSHWLTRHRPSHRCRVQRLTPTTFAIWIEARA